MSNFSIGVAIPSIPVRGQLLRRAVNSVLNQTLPAAGISVAMDLEREGAPNTRHRALMGVQTEWVAFLDDDDWFYPEHLEVLANAAEESGADYVFSYYMVHDGNGHAHPEIDPLGHFGKVFDPEVPTQTTITTLVRTELAKSVGFRPVEEGKEINGERYGEDFQFTVECIAAGAKILHVPQRTFAWSHWVDLNPNSKRFGQAGNTSGLADRW